MSLAPLSLIPRISPARPRSSSPSIRATRSNLESLSRSFDTDPTFDLHVTINALGENIKLEQTGHELDLIEHGLENKQAEVTQGTVRQIAATIEIIPSPLIRRTEMVIVNLALSCQSPGKRP